MEAGGSEKDILHEVAYMNGQLAMLAGNGDDFALNRKSALAKLLLSRI